MRTISETIRLFSLILLLPLLLLLIGPLLVLAVLRGQQGMGPITWNTARYHPAGRLGILMLGLILWLLVWGGLAWLFLNTPFQPVLAQIIPPSATPTKVVEIALPADPTFTPSLTSTPGSSTSPTFTPSRAQETATPTPMATRTPAVEAQTEVSAETPSPTSSPSATATATEPTLTPTATATSTPAATPTSGPTPTPGPTPTFGERAAAVETVKNANVLLRDAIALANEENLGKLRTVWQGKALTVMENFAIDLYDRYTQPFTVEFEYLQLPTPQVLTQTGQFVVVTQERWSYTGPTTTNREAFEFVYTLERVGGRWAITSYAFRNLPALSSREVLTLTPTRTPTSARGTPTPTPTPPPN